MERKLSNELKSYVGQEVHVKGWLHSLRMLGAVNFLHIRDRGGITQVVIQDKEELQKVKDLQPGSVLSVTGKVQEAAQFETGAEIIEPAILVDVSVTEAWPVEVNKPEIRAGLDTILDHRPLTLRNKKISAVFKIQGVILEAYREFLIENGFTEFMGPAIINASSEGGAELFTVDYFGHDVKLSQSNQLYKQMMVGVYERVFGSLKCFRAEKSNTRRHITEATQLEFEVGFIEKFEDVLNWEERVIRAIYKKVQEKCADELKMFKNFAILKDEVKIPRYTLKEALELYFKETGTDERNENDMSPEAERFISNYVKEKEGIDFVFVTQFPRTKCAFYAKPNEEDSDVCNYGDLICNGAEVSSGGQRIDNHDQLVESLKMKELDPKDFEDYLSIFKYGMPKHGGFGLGLERFTMQLLGLENIREAVLFPSDTKRVASIGLKQEVVVGEENIVAKIKGILDKKGFVYDYKEHEPTPTSEDSARVRGTMPEEGVKALILKGAKDDKNIMVCVPGNKKIEMKKLALLLGQRYSFEDPQVIKDRFGLVIGGVPPFGNILGLDTYFDDDVLDQERAAFNCGTQTQSITMKSKELVEMADGLVVDLT